MTKCAVTSCKNEADPRLIHKYSGKTFCPKCARQVNQWNPKEHVIPFPKDDVKEASDG